MTFAGGEDLIEERSVDEANGRFVVEDEGDGDAEHGEEVGVVYCAVERVHAPGRSGGYEIVF